MPVDAHVARRVNFQLFPGAAAVMRISEKLVKNRLKPPFLKDLRSPRYSAS